MCNFCATFVQLNASVDFQRLISCLLLDNCSQTAESPLF